MISNRSGSQQSEFMQALVPMVDLFAVLAIVFMIHSNEEITAAQTENDERIHEIVAEVQEARNALEAIDELERARRERREWMANAASKSLEQIREERERQAQELLAQVTEMLATQQSSAAAEFQYELGCFHMLLLFQRNRFPLKFFLVLVCRRNWKRQEHSWK